MTSRRAQAYGRVVRTIDDMGAAKLLPREQQLIRDAADTLFFCEDVAGDEGALSALAAVRGLAEHLVETGSWVRQTADRLVDDVSGCGPLLAADVR